MRIALGTTLILFILTCAHVTAGEAITEVDGKRISLTANCSVSKFPDSVYVIIGKKKFKVKLPEALQFRFGAGEKAWIGLAGTCRVKKLGAPGLSAESADGYIEVEKILFYDQKAGHKPSIRILAKEKPNPK